MKTKTTQPKGTAANEYTHARRLLIMACGGQKVEGAVRADAKYAGPSHKTMRAFIRDSGWAGFETLILSAKLGITRPSTFVDDYDQRMTEETAARQLSRNVAMLRAIIEDARRSGRPFQEVFIFASSDYLRALGAFDVWALGTTVKVVARGRGIGDQLASLKAWIAERGEAHYTTADERKSETFEEWLALRPHMREPQKLNRDRQGARVSWLSSPTLEEWLEAFPSMRRAAMI